jgi:hypothetical protein
MCLGPYGREVTFEMSLAIDYPKSSLLYFTHRTSLEGIRFSVNRPCAVRISLPRVVASLRTPSSPEGLPVVSAVGTPPNAASH